MATPNFVTDKLDIRTLDTLKNAQLNHALGADGAPKYSVNQMKQLTKNKLHDELLGEMTDWAEAHPVAVKKADAGPKGAIQKVSANRDCAASKLCNAIKALMAGKKTEAMLWEMYEFDTVLQEYCDRAKFTAKIDDAKLGLRPKAGRTVVQLALFNI